jgi:hypothetical protein
MMKSLQEVWRSCILKKKKDWADWPFVWRSHCGMLSLSVGTLMDHAIVAIAPIPMSLDVGDVKVHSGLYHLLVLTTQHTVLRIVRGVATGDGLEAWRKLQELWACDSWSQAGTLERHPRDEASLEVIGILGGLNRWEQNTAKYKSGGELFSENAQTAFALHALPGKTRSSVIVSAPTNAAYPQIRPKIEELVLTVPPPEMPRQQKSQLPARTKNTHRGARTHDHKVKGLALYRLS